MQNIFDITSSLQENAKNVQILLLQLKRNTHKPHFQIQAAAELRRHIEAARSIMETSIKFEAALAFEEIILDALSEVDNATRLKVMERLKKAEGALSSRRFQTNLRANRKTATPKSTERE